MSKKIKVEFEIIVPDIKHTDEQLKEWLRFELGDNGECRSDNPFLEHCVEPILGTFKYEDVY